MCGCGCWDLNLIPLPCPASMVSSQSSVMGICPVTWNWGWGCGSESPRPRPVEAMLAIPHWAERQAVRTTERWPLEFLKEAQEGVCASLASETILPCSAFPTIMNLKLYHRDICVVQKISKKEKSLQIHVLSKDNQAHYPRCFIWKHFLVA